MDLFETLGLGPRQPEENELYVAIYADPPAGPGSGQEEGSPDQEGQSTSSGPGEGAAAALHRLEALRERCTAWLLPYIADYVWNKDPLILRTSSRQPPPWERRAGPGGRPQPQAPLQEEEGSPPPPQAAVGVTTAGGGGGVEGCVWSVVRFGDAVDDEWWVVWLLLAMTRELQDLSVQVWDNDGQFLLIEAAYALPRWLKPELANNRVWLRCGRLHIIPLPSSAAPDLPPSPSAAQALAVLREGIYATASPRVQRPIDQRLEGYPARARKEQQHVARCLLPIPLAVALRAEPQLVAELVEAFYLRGADDMRAASRMRVLPPSLDRAPVLLRMTRCHYAQLAQQRFSGPRGWPMPPPDSPLFKAADLGLKLTVAAEIICARYPDVAGGAGRGGGDGNAISGDTGAACGAESSSAAGQVQRDVAEAVGTAAAAGPSSGGLSEATFAGNPAWRRFKASLEANGYFQGNIPGSRRYKELLAAALEAFAAGMSDSGEAASAAPDASGEPVVGYRPRDPRRRLAELVRGAVAEGAKPEDAAGTAGSRAAEDDDSWLDQNPERLQFELGRRQAELQEHTSRRSGRSDTESRSATHASGEQQEREVDADDIAFKLRSFMEQLSGLEGAEAPGPLEPVEGAEWAGVDFHPGRFLHELQKVLGPGLDEEGRRKGTGRARARGAPGGGQRGEVDEEEEAEEEEASSSGEEGSSFFSDDGEEDDDDDDEEEVEEEGGKVVGDEVGQAQSSVMGRAAAGAPGKLQSRAPEPLVRGKHQQVPFVGGSAAGDQQKPVTTPSSSSALPVAATNQAPPPPPLTLKPGFLGKRAADNMLTSRKPASHNNAGAGAVAAALPTRPRSAAVSSVRMGAAEGAVSSSSQHASATARRPATSPIIQAGGGRAAGPDEARRQSAGEGVPRGDVRWEISTATDSDDEEGEEEEEEEDSEGPEGDEAHEAMARLMAALGVQEDGGSSDGEDGGGGGVMAGADRRTAPSGRPGPEGGMATVGNNAGVGPQCRGWGRQQPATGAAAACGGGDEFMSLYDNALQAELAGTTLTQSFADRARPGAAAAGAMAAAAMVGGGAAEAGTAAAGAAGAQGLQPVDLDMNLVRNLLRSYTAQQGLAGPAGNIAAMLGVSLVAGEIEE